MVHHRPGSNKLTNEKSCVRLKDRERSVLAGDQAMCPPVHGDEVARGGIQREKGGERRRSGRMVFGFEETGLMKVVVLL